MNHQEIEDIVTDLGYSMSQAEADHLNELLMANDIEGAQNLLKQHLDEKDVPAVCEFLRAEQEGVDVDLEEVPRARWGYYLGEKLIGRRGQRIGYLYHMRDDILYLGNDRIKLDELHQVWLAIPKK